MRLMPYQPSENNPGVVHYKIVEVLFNDGTLEGWSSPDLGQSIDRLKEQTEEMLKAFDRPLFLGK